MQESDLFRHLNQDSIDFIKYCNTKKINLIERRGNIEVILSGDFIKDYFVSTGEDSSKYCGKILNGKLYLSVNQFEDYVNKRKINGII